MTFFHFDLVLTASPLQSQDNLCSSYQQAPDFTASCRSLRQATIHSRLKVELNPSFTSPVYKYIMPSHCAERPLVLSVDVPLFEALVEIHVGGYFRRYHVARIAVKLFYCFIVP